MSCRIKTELAGHFNKSTTMLFLAAIHADEGWNVLPDGNHRAVMVRLKGNVRYEHVSHINTEFYLNTIGWDLWHEKCVSGGTVVCVMLVRDSEVAGLCKNLIVQGD